MTQSLRMDRRALLTRLAKTTGALIALPLGLKSALAQQPPASFVGTTAGQAREVDGVAVRWCPPGRFLMGSPENEPGRRADERQVQVTISTGFWMAAYEVTQSQWRRIVGAFPDRPPSAEFGEGDTFPMYWVNYAEAETFCRRLTERAQKSSGLPAGWTFALPTEAQWEYACRAGTTTASSFGDSLSRAHANITDPPPSGARFGAGLGRVDAGRNLSRQSLGPVRHARQHLRVVPRLVSRAAAGRHRSGDDDERRTRTAMVPTLASGAAAPGMTPPCTAVRPCGCATNPNGARITSAFASPSSGRHDVARRLRRCAARQRHGHHGARSRPRLLPSRRDDGVSDRPLPDDGRDLSHAAG